MQNCFIHTLQESSWIIIVVFCDQNEIETVADPGFPRDGKANSTGEGVTNIRFCQIFPKTA